MSRVGWLTRSGPNCGGTAPTLPRRSSSSTLVCASARSRSRSRRRTWRRRARSSTRHLRRCRCAMRRASFCERRATRRPPSAPPSPTAARAVPGPQRPPSSRLVPSRCGTQAADVWSVGAILFYMLTGEPLVRLESVEAGGDDSAEFDRLCRAVIEGREEDLLDQARDLPRSPCLSPWEELLGQAAPPPLHLQPPLRPSPSCSTPCPQPSCHGPPVPCLAPLSGGTQAAAKVRSERFLATRLRLARRRAPEAALQLVRNAARPGLRCDVRREARRGRSWPAPAAPKLKMRHLPPAGVRAPRAAAHHRALEAAHRRGGAETPLHFGIIRARTALDGGFRPGAAADLARPPPALAPPRPSSPDLARSAPTSADLVDQALLPRMRAFAASPPLRRVAIAVEAHLLTPDGWLKLPPALLEDSAPSARLLPHRAESAPELGFRHVLPPGPRTTPPSGARTYPSARQRRAARACWTSTRSARRCARRGSPCPPTSALAAG